MLDQRSRCSPSTWSSQTWLRTLLVAASSWRRLNTAPRFDALYSRSSAYYGNAKRFAQAAAASWRAVHPEFSAGNQGTLFRPGKDEAFQLDHLLCDRKTWDAATGCAVLQVPYLGELSDHASLAVDIVANMEL